VYYVRQGTTHATTLLATLLHSRYAPGLTHTLLVVLLAVEFVLILEAPLWAVLVPGTMIHHRVGLLLHEYVHGIPLRRYRHNLWVLSAVNGVLITFGLMEVFRANHLAHHRWCNTDRDPSFKHEQQQSVGPRGLLRRSAWVLYRALCGDHGISMYLKHMVRSFTTRKPYLKRSRILLELGLSALWIAFWIAVGRPGVVLTLIVLHLGIAIPTALRGVVEHSSYRGNPDFANDYKVWVPVLNINRHIHHHIDPTCPWYLREFYSVPLPPVSYWIHWYRTFVKRDYVFMHPMTRSLVEKANQEKASLQMRAPRGAGGVGEVVA
jgi:fatty acid desaturase